LFFGIGAAGFNEAVTSAAGVIQVGEAALLYWLMFVSLHSRGAGGLLRPWRFDCLGDTDGGAASALGLSNLHADIKMAGDVVFISAGAWDRRRYPRFLMIPIAILHQRCIGLPRFDLLFLLLTQKIYPLILLSHLRELDRPT
jgi:hypothetical protein